MAFRLTADVQVGRDNEGQVRMLSHREQPYLQQSAESQPGFGLAADAGTPATTPRALAEAYIQDIAPILNLAPEAVANFAAAPSVAPVPAPTELRFQEERALPNAAMVSYGQTHLGLPVWNAGVSVRMDTAPLAVTGAHNSMEYALDGVGLPGRHANYLPHCLDAEKLIPLLGLGNPGDLTITATRLLIYRYDAEERFDSQILAHENADGSTGIAGVASPRFPSLPLPPLSSEFVSGRPWVVTEVLFKLSFESWGRLNWRAFVEPETGAILYLRALVSCASGRVFASDPVSLSGSLLAASSPVATLDAIRSAVPLLGLPPAAAGQSLPLSGEFVILRDLEPPSTPLPSLAAPHDFSYSSDTDGFAACSAYYHCDGFFRMMAGMGFDPRTYFNNTTFPVPVDPHARFGAVNAAALGNISSNGTQSLVFGLAAAGHSFGIASDVRVVIHEFGHALLWDNVDSPNFGFAHSAGDAMAAILHDPESHAPDRFETFPFMAASGSLSRRHDRLVTGGWAWGGLNDDRQYSSEQILSTVLFRVYRAAGGDSPDLAERKRAARHLCYVIIKACGLLSFSSRNPQVLVDALLDADGGSAFEGYPGGTLRKVIRWSFEKQGLYQLPGAPTPVAQEGNPPEIDVFIEDGRHGGYLPFGPGSNSEIWNRLAPDAGTAHQAAQVGVPNQAFVRVGNRGTRSAGPVTVNGFQARQHNPTTWPTHWKAIATPSQSLAAPLAPGGTAVVGPFQWIPEFAGHPILFTVSAPGDRSIAETILGASLSDFQLAALENNVARKVM